MILILIGALRIVSTYSVFNETADEPCHIASGMEWLDLGTYDYDYPHTPLPVVAAALGPYLEGARSSVAPYCEYEGQAILYGNGHYERNLTLARLGTLPFFLIAATLVFFVGTRLYGKPAGLAALLLFTILPPVLAHAGVATADMAATASLLAVVFAFLQWLDRPGWRTGVLFGLAGGFALLSRFSAVVFFPVCAFPVLVLFIDALSARRLKLWTAIRGRLPSLAVACAITFLLVWAGYKFSFGPVLEPGMLDYPAIKGLPGPLKTVLQAPFPAYEFTRGLIAVWFHNREGHIAYFMGEVSTNGWWYFFPVVLGVKTPLGFLILFVAGSVLLWRRMDRATAFQQLAPLLATAFILIVSLFSRLDLGVRYILPVYPMMAMVAGCGVIALLRWRRQAGRWLAGGLLAWIVISSAMTHPDYLAYFNELAGGRPEWITVDSDLDWGQDLKRLSRKLKELGADEVYLDYFGTADLKHHGLPRILDIDLEHPPSGWVAVSLLQLMQKQQKYAWLEGVKPVAMAGKSIRIYRLP